MNNQKKYQYQSKFSNFYLFKDKTFATKNFKISHIENFLWKEILIRALFKI